MKNFKRGDDRDRGGFRKPFGGSNSFGRKPSFRRDDRGGRPTEMFDAICSQCGDKCEVPFRPTGGKPVLCNNCFGKKDGGNFGGRDRRSQRDFGRPSNDRGNFQSDDIKNQLIALNTKLDKIIGLMEGAKSVETTPTPAAAPKEKAKEKPVKKAAPVKKTKKAAKK